MRLRWAALALILLTGCKQAKDKKVFVDPALEILVPPDTTMATGADLDAIRTTHVFQKYVGELSLPQLNEFVKKTGVDPRKDIWQVLSCSNGKTGLFLARGKFSEGDAEPRIAIDGVNRMNYKGLNMFGNDQTAVLFLTPSSAAAGRTADLRTLVDLRNQGEHGLPKALKEKVGTISHDNQIWAVFTGGLENLNLGVPESSNVGQALRAFKGIQGGTLAVNLRDGFQFEAHLECKTPADAKHVRDALKGIIGLGRLSTPEKQPEMLKLYDGIEVANIETKVDVTAKIAADLEDKFLDLWLKQR
jgi:hypothetical protein